MSKEKPLTMGKLKRIRNMDLYLRKPGESNHNSKLTDQRARELRSTYQRKGAFCARLRAKAIGIHVSTLYKMLNGTTWKHLSEVRTWRTKYKKEVKPKDPNRIATSITSYDPDDYQGNVVAQTTYDDDYEGMQKTVRDTTDQRYGFNPITKKWDNVDKFDGENQDTQPDDFSQLVPHKGRRKRK